MTTLESNRSSSHWRSFISDDRVLTGIILIVWLVMIISIGNRDRLWDFKTYYYASVAQAHGENPYDLEALNRYAHDKIELPFVYPVTTCYLFRPFTRLPYNVAYHIWLWLKVVIAVYLFWLWRTRFIRWGPLWLMLLIGSGAYLSALYRDLTAGNVALIEQAFLWTGFWLLLDKKPFQFAVAVAFAAVFKFTLALFLPLLLLSRIRNRWPALLLGGAIVSGYATANWMLDPQLFREFVAVGTSLKEYTAAFNHSTLAVFHDIGKLVLGAGVDSSGNAVVIFMLYAVFAAIVAAVTFKAVRQHWPIDSPAKLLWVGCALCFLYALALPRTKNYTQLLLIVPTFIVVSCGLSRKWAIIFTILLLLPRIKMAAPDTIFGFYQYLHPWIMTVMVWIGFLWYTPAIIARLSIEGSGQGR